MLKWLLFQQTLSELDGFFSLSCFLGSQHHDVNDEYALIFYSLVIITLQLKQGKWEIVKWISFFFFSLLFYSFLSTFFSWCLET